MIVTLCHVIRTPTQPSVASFHANKVTEDETTYCWTTLAGIQHSEEEEHDMMTWYSECDHVKETPAHSTGTPSGPDFNFTPLDSRGS